MNELAIRVLIADDEPLMREQLHELLTEIWPELDVVAQAANGVEAWDRYVETEPDLVFLDIRMPGLSGLEVAQRIGDGAEVVFVTAYDQYAIAAFERGAVDYVLKPVEPDRLGATIKRLRTRLAARKAEVSAVSRSAAPDLARLVNELKQSMQPEARHYLKWIKASTGKLVKLIAVEDILYFQADTKYTRVVQRDGEALIRTPLKDLLVELDPERFWQIHRGTVVNTAAIASLYREEAERQFVLLKDRPERLTVSRPFYHLFKND